jgi:hypothetical protein
MLHLQRNRPAKQNPAAGDRCGALVARNANGYVSSPSPSSECRDCDSPLVARQFRGLGDEDRQASRDEKGDRGAGASVGRDHAPHVG